MILKAIYSISNAFFSYFMLLYALPSPTYALIMGIARLKYLSAVADYSRLKYEVPMVRKRRVESGF